MSLTSFIALDDVRAVVFAAIVRPKPALRQFLQSFKLLRWFKSECADLGEELPLTSYCGSLGSVQQIYPVSYIQYVYFNLRISHERQWGAEWNPGID